MQDPPECTLPFVPRILARVALVSSAEFGGMAANDGPVPVRALAYAARLIRDARDLPRYGISTPEPMLDYGRLLARVREIVHDVRARTALRERIDALGVTARAVLRRPLP